MTNEILLAVSLNAVCCMGRCFCGFTCSVPGGMMAFTVFATIAANIEVMILVDAFGMEMTLGNILFATTFLVTDILSEVAGKGAGAACGLGGHSPANVLLYPRHRSLRGCCLRRR